jgi:hypothetical protein
MSHEPIVRKALRAAERGAHADASGLVASVPELLREARRRRAEAGGDSPTLAQLATWALPRLAAATAVAVVVATSFVSWELRTATTTAAFESVILGADGDGTGDAVFDDLLDLEGNDG